jgi:tetratricopeptide (TPR) repeat protein
VLLPGKFAILGDSPVRASGDRLNFNDFVEPFAERLIQSAANTPFTVGIFADWGQGKSTVMQMLRLATEDKKCPTIWFEPWKHNTREAVWKGLALTMVTQIRANEKLASEVRRKASSIKRFSAKALWGFLIGKDWAEELLTAIEKEPWSPTLLHEFEENLNTLFALFQEGPRKDSTPMVLFVDDLDRCLPDAALAVMEALKLVLNRPGLITVMGIAETELSRAVMAAYGKELKEAKVELDPGWGQKYIRKIIQMPFPLPVISEASFHKYVGSCLDESFVGTALGNDARWLEIIREACESNLREVKRFINHFISEVDKATANSETNQHSLNPPRVAFVLLLAWRFGDFLMHIRRRAGERELLVRYQLYFAQQASGERAEAALLPEPDSPFAANVLLRDFFNRCFTGDTVLVLPFAEWSDIEPYLQFGLRAPKGPAAPVAERPESSAAAGQAAPSVTYSTTAKSQVTVPPAAPPAQVVPPSTQSTPPAPSESGREFAARVQTLISERRFDEALRASMAAMPVLASTNDHSGLATMWDLIGSIHQSQQDTRNANDAYERALEIAHKAGLKRETAGILLNLGRLNLHHAPEVAERYAQEALNIAKETGDPLTEANALADLAEAHKERGNKEQAVELYHAARGIYRRLQFPRGELLALGRLAEMCMDDEPKRAQIWIADAVKLAEGLGDKEALLRLLSNGAHVEASLNPFSDTAEDYFARATRLAGELGDQEELAELEKERAALRDVKAMKTTRDIPAPPRARFKRTKEKTPDRRLR